MIITLVPGSVKFRELPDHAGYPPWRLSLLFFFFSLFWLEAIAKPDFTVILNEVKDLKSLKIRDSSLRSE